MQIQKTTSPTPQYVSATVASTPLEVPLRAPVEAPATPTTEPALNIGRTRSSFNPHVIAWQKAALALEDAHRVSPAQIPSATKDLAKAETTWKRDTLRARAALPDWEGEYVSTLQRREHAVAAGDTQTTRLLELRLDVLDVYRAPSDLDYLDRLLAHTTPLDLQEVEAACWSFLARRSADRTEKETSTWLVLAGVASIAGVVSPVILAPVTFLPSPHPLPLLPFLVAALVFPVSLLGGIRTVRSIEEGVWSPTPLPPTTPLTLVPSTPFTLPPRPARSPHSPRSARRERFATLQKAATSLRDQYAAAEEDLALLLRAPALVDSTTPTTLAFLESLHALSDMPSSLPDEPTLTRFEEHLTRAEVTWTAAKDYALRVGTRLLPAEDRRRLEKASALLALAANPAASEFERSEALRRLRETVDGLLVLPQKALAALEASTRLELGA